MGVTESIKCAVDHQFLLTEKAFDTLVSSHKELEFLTQGGSRSYCVTVY